ncbi:MAG: lysophospholipid acyltransferase family protein [Bacilli bacterium]|nr:lysophospholipid acyltransferase family protein [Bacilli bacterium]
MKKNLKKILKLFMKLFYKVEVINQENVPSEGKAVLCCNHIHALDGPLVVAFTDRKVNFLAKQELWNDKILAHFLNEFGAISVDRQKPKLNTFREAKKVLDNDELLGIFPEGTRNGMAKNMEAKDGAAYFAISNNAPVVPIKLLGNYRIFSKVKVIYGTPLVLVNRDVKEGTKQIMQAINDLDDQNLDRGIARTYHC